MTILGIDPGLASCGWAVIEVVNEDNRKDFQLLAYGTIKTSVKSPVKDRLTEIFNSLKKIFKKYNPGIVSIEKQFYSKISQNIINSYLATGIVYLLCGIHNVDLYEFSAKTVKTALTGYGSASKYQLKKMVKILCNLDKQINSEHVNDAIATALCCLHSM